MKRILFALALFAFALPTVPKAQAAEVSIDFFYTNLTGGSWIEAGDYGYCWQPDIAVSNSDWRPYADGYWAYTDVGWTWVSYEDFGWATYHYGRWSRLRDHGWVWVPGYEWGPAWVSWRTGGDYVGWAPLPPRRYGYGGDDYIYEGRAIGTSVDIEFDIGPMYYNFVDVRYIGAPVLREHIYEPAQNITYINRTVNVTNITYNNSTVYNYGPDYDRLSAYSTRPIQRLTLQRDASVDYTSAAQSAALSKVQGDRLIVAAPPRLERPRERKAPKTVKTRVENPNIETGWMGVTDPNAKAQIQEKMKKEDPKSVPPPQIPPKNPDALNAAAPGASGGTETTKVPIASDVAAPSTKASKLDRGGRGKGNDKRRDDAAPGAQPQPVDGSAPAQGTDIGAAPSGADEQRGRGNNNKDRRGRDRVQPPPSQPGGAPSDAATPDAGSLAPAPQDQPRGRGNRGDRGRSTGVPSNAPVEPPASAAPEAAPPQPAPGQENDRRGRGKKDRGGDAPGAASFDRPPEVQAPPQQAPPAAAPNPEPRRERGDNPGRGRGKEKRDRVEMPPQGGPAADFAPPPQAAPREIRQQQPPRMKRERQEPPANMAPPPQAGPAAGGPAPAAPEGRGKPERGNKKKDKDNDR